MNNFKTNLQPIEVEQATGNLLETYQSILKGLGFVPNLYKNLGNTPELLTAYLQLSDLLKQTKNFTPAEKDVIALSISKFNDCKYCISVHTMTSLKFSGVSADVVSAIQNNQPIPDEKLNILYITVQKIIANKGVLEKADVDKFFEYGYNDYHLFDIILEISQKTISNYANHLFQTTIDEQFKLTN